VGKFREVSDWCHADDSSHLAADSAIATVTLKCLNTAGSSR
jgi:hypothetical protein